MKIAVLGASGFIGTRLVEQFVLGRIGEVIPIVRSFQSLAVIARLDLPWRVCNLMNTDDLARALAGCDAVVHAALGDPGQIVKMAYSIYAAAEKAGVKRLVVLSSAAVHGLNPQVGTDENSPISDRQAMEYNNAKVRAERVLLRARHHGRVEVVLLRPSIVYGPRCRLFTRVLEKLIAETAFLIDRGQGTCNAIYVDNLVQAIHLALDCEKADGEAFLVGDVETVTWQHVYEKLAQAVGANTDSIHHVKPPIFRKSLQERVEGILSKPLGQWILPAFPGQAKRLTKVVLGALKETPQPTAWTLSQTTQAIVDEEMATLQQCRWKYPNSKAARVLGFKPTVSFAEGLRRTVSWMEFSGYPVLSERH